MKKKRKKTDRHYEAALDISSCYVYRESSWLMSHGDFHLFFLDSKKNPLRKKLYKSCLAVIYCPFFSKRIYYQNHSLPQHRYIVALANPLNRRWINSKPSISSMWRVLTENGLPFKAKIKNMRDFCLAVYDLLFTIGEYQFLER